MRKIDGVVWKETGFMAAWVLVFSAVMQAVFLVLGKWDITVLLGNLLSAAAVIVNYFLMALSVQRALDKAPKDAAQAMKLSGMARLLMLFGVVLVGVLLKQYFSIWTVLIPLLFPRIAIAFRMLGKKNGAKEGEHEG